MHPRCSRCLCDVCNLTLYNNPPAWAGSWSCCSRSLALVTYWSQLTSFAVLWACAAFWTAIPCHSPLFSYFSKTDLCPPYACVQPPKSNTFHRTRLPCLGTRGPPRAGCWADTVGLFPRERCCFGLLHKCSSLCQLVHCRVLLEMGEPSRLLSPCLQNAVLFFYALWFESLWVMMGHVSCSENRKKHGKLRGHTKTKWDNISVPLELIDLMKMWRRF